MKKELTAIIVSFFRVEYLEKCLQSMREQYPDINIIVGNNGNSDERKDELCRKYNAVYRMLPYDCGVCVGRNRLVELVQTPFVLIGDDDFYYEDESNVKSMLDVIKVNDIDLIGGRIREGGKIKDYQGFIHDKGNYFEYEKLKVSKNKNYQYCDLTFNYFVARTSAVKKVGWDEKIKVAYEHSTFFIDFKKAGYKTSFCFFAVVTHKPDISISNRQEYDDYRKFRNRKDDKKRFFQKYKIDYTITMSGYKDTFDRHGIDRVDFLITTFERKECLKSLLFSIAKFYPNANITIADQSKIFDVPWYKKMWEYMYAIGFKNKPKAYNCGYDVGLSWCRNFLVEKTNRQYKLILEDDFVFTKDTKVHEMIEKIEANPKYSIIGGAVVENGHELDFVHDFEIDGDTLYHKKPAKGIALGKEVDCIPNFFLAKKEVFEDVLWDEQIKINGEHTDFFLRLYKTEHRVLYANYISINHEKPRDQEYKKFRNRKDGLVHFFKKNNLKRMVYINNFCYELDGDNIKSYSNYKK